MGGGGVGGGSDGCGDGGGGLGSGAFHVAKPNVSGTKSIGCSSTGQRLRLHTRHVECHVKAVHAGSTRHVRAQSVGAASSCEPSGGH